jgi:hypothetical protein
VFRFWQERYGCDFGEAKHAIAELAHMPIPEVRNKRAELRKKMAALPQPSSTKKQKPALPALRQLSDGEVAQLASLRGLSGDGIRLARQRELLLFGQVNGFDSWIVTDREQINAQARRMDGICYPPVGDLAERKAHTLAGSVASWPIGTPNIQPGKTVIFVEGGPDLLAGHHFVYCENREVDCVVVAMLGSSQRIDSRALPILATARHIRFFPHLDRPGCVAASRWAGQLKAAGVSKLDAFSFAGLLRADEKPVNDLNDSVFVDADVFEKERSLWAVIP